MVTKVHKKKIRRDASPARKLVTSLLNVLTYRKRNQMRNLRKQISNPTISEARSRRVLRLLGKI